MTLSAAAAGSTAKPSPVTATRIASAGRCPCRRRPVNSALLCWWRDCETWARDRFRMLGAETGRSRYDRVGIGVLRYPWRWFAGPNRGDRAVGAILRRGLAGCARSVRTAGWTIPSHTPADLAVHGACPYRRVDLAGDEGGRRQEPEVSLGRRQ